MSPDLAGVDVCGPTWVSPLSLASLKLLGTCKDVPCSVAKAIGLWQPLPLALPSPPLWGFLPLGCVPTRTRTSSSSWPLGLPCTMAFGRPRLSFASWPPVVRQVQLRILTTAAFLPGITSRPGCAASLPALSAVTPAGAGVGWAQAEGTGSSQSPRVAEWAQGCRAGQVGVRGLGGPGRTVGSPFPYCMPTRTTGSRGRAASATQSWSLASA